MQNVFDPKVVSDLAARINRLAVTTTPAWGKMSVDQMLAHCNVTYEMVYENKHPKPGVLKRFLLNTFVKNAVVGPKPYKRNSPTAPVFKVKGHRDFDMERKRLVAFLNRVQKEGAQTFDGRESGHSYPWLDGAPRPATRQQNRPFGPAPHSRAGFSGRTLLGVPRHCARIPLEVTCAIRCAIPPSGW